MRLASVQGVTGLVETAGDDVLARLDPRIAVGNPIELGSELGRAPERRRCKEATDLCHVDFERLECRIRRYELVEQESRPLGLAGIERQPGTFAQVARSVCGSRFSRAESIMAAACASAVAPSPRAAATAREHLVRDRVHELSCATVLEVRGRPVAGRIPVTRDEVVERTLGNERVLEAAPETARQLDPLTVDLPGAVEIADGAENRAEVCRGTPDEMRVRPSRELERAVERLDLGIRVAVSALSEAEGDPGHENLLGGAELLCEREDSHALLERDALARKQGRTPGEGADPCGDARLRKVGDECDRPLVVRQRRLLSAAEAKDIAQVGLGFRRRLDLAGGPEPIGGLLQLRDPLRP